MTESGEINQLLKLLGVQRQDLRAARERLELSTREKHDNLTDYLRAIDMQEVIAGIKQELRAWGVPVEDEVENMSLSHFYFTSTEDWEEASDITLSSEIIQVDRGSIQSLNTGTAKTEGTLDPVSDTSIYVTTTSATTTPTTSSTSKPTNMSMKPPSSNKEVTAIPSYAYDVFISYSEDSEDWVQDELIPRLAQAGIIYIEQQKFFLGRPKLNETERAIQSSRWTLLILTPKYLEDNWSQFDSILTASYGLDTSRWRTIPAIVETCDLPLRLAALVPADLRSGQEQPWRRLLEMLLIHNLSARLNQPKAEPKKSQPKEEPQPPKSVKKTTVERNQVFISYSHADDKWLKQLQVHLRPLVRSEQFKVWDGTLIAPGSNWREEIDKAIKVAKVAILLISAHYLASDFVVNEELPPLLAAAEQEGAIILPVIIGHCRFLQSKSLSRYQAVNDPSQPLAEMPRSRRDKVFVKISEAVELALN